MSRLILLPGWALLTSASVLAADFTVNSEADGADFSPGDGVCEVTDGGGDCSLRAAIMETNALGGAHLINLPAGTFVLTLAGDDTDSAVGDLNVLETQLTVSGAGRDDSIIDGNGIDRVMSISAGQVLLRDLTIRNGVATVTSVLGGAISLFGGPTPNTLTLQRVHLTGNSANAGGALFAPSNGVVTIEDSLFSENATVPLGVTNRDGAAIFCSSCMLQVTGSTFASNGAGNDTIAAHTDATLQILNSTISGNEAGGVRTQNADALIKFSTLAENGGWNLSHFSFENTEFMQVANSVLQIEAGIDCISNDKPVSLGYNLSGDDSCELAGMGDLQNTDALLEPLQDSGGSTPTQTPGVGSSAIERVPLAACTDLADAPLAHDQRGFTRPVGANCDAGAVEALLQVILRDGFESE